MSRPLYKRMYHKVIKPVLNFITLSKLRYKVKRKKDWQCKNIFDEKNFEIVGDQSCLSRFAVEMIEKDVNSDRVVYIFQHQMFDFEGKSCFYGGAERYVLDLAEILCEKQFKPVLVQIGSLKVGLWKRKVKKLTLYGLPVADIFEYSELVRFFEKYSFVIYSGAVSVWGKKIHPNIMISHGITWDVPNVDCNIQEFFDMIKDVDKFVSVDTSTISWFKATFSKTLENFNCYYIPNYVDITKYKPITKSEKNKVRIMFPRRSSLERGYWLVSSILKKILDRYKNVEFVFVGYAHGNDIRRDLDYWQKKYKGRVFHYCVPPDEMPKFYQDADISLIPTLYSEGTSLSCLEAQACGNVIISTFVGGLPNLILDGYNGLLINSDRQSLLSALDKVLSDNSLSLELSKNAISVAKAFNKDVWVDRWEKVIGNIKLK